MQIQSNIPKNFIALNFNKNYHFSQSKSAFVLLLRERKSLHPIYQFPHKIVIPSLMLILSIWFMPNHIALKFSMIHMDVDAEIISSWNRTIPY